MKIDHLPPNVMRILISLLTRIPFLNGVSLLLLLSERANREKHPPFPPIAIYIQIGLFVLVGSGMSSNLRRKECALLYAGQIVFYELLLASSSTLNYPNWLLARVLTRSSSTIAVYLYLAFLCEPLENGHIRTAARPILGFYALARGYTLLVSTEETIAMAASVGMDPQPFTVSLAWLQGVLFALTGLSLIGKGVLLGENRALWMLAICVLFSCASHEWNAAFWKRQFNVDFWIHLRLLFDDLTTVLGIVVVNNRCVFFS